MNKLRIGIALCGSYCTYSKLFPAVRELAEKYELVPIMSDTASLTDSRFGSAAENVETLKNICGALPVTDIVSAEPLGPTNPHGCSCHRALHGEHHGKARKRHKRQLGHDGGKGAPAQ